MNKCFVALMIWTAVFAQGKDSEEIISLKGLPIQLEWADIDGNGQLDLIALMLKTKIEGTVDTWFEDGALRGLYADQTTREKYLATYLQQDRKWTLAHSIPLDQAGVLGFALSHAKDAPHLMIWRNDVLLRYRWENEWNLERQLGTPGLLAEEAASLSDFPFWYEDKGAAWWMVPDFGGMHVHNMLGDEGTHFVPFPRSAFFDSSRSELGHTIKLPLPKLLHLDGDDTPEMVFADNKNLSGFRLGETEPAYNTDLDGMLADFNGDGMLDLITTEVDDIDRPKDLPRVKTLVRTYLAEAPLQFAEEPTANQKVPGMLINTDEDIQFARPFIDINNDGRTDLGGLAFKLSLFQAGKLLITGRMTFKFLLSLSVQNEDGSFREIPGGPFSMSWKINIRRLRMPSFAELTADFDGDGWTDLLMEKGNKLLVTPVRKSGIAPKPWKRSIPRLLREPDQVYGRDLDGDGKASFVVVKFGRDQTHLGILEHGQ